MHFFSISRFLTCLVFQFSIHSFFWKANFAWIFWFKAQLILNLELVIFLVWQLTWHEVMQFLFLHHFGFSFFCYILFSHGLFFTYFLEIYDLEFTYLDLGAWTSFEAWISLWAWTVVRVWTSLGTFWLAFWIWTLHGTIV